MELFVAIDFDCSVETSLMQMQEKIINSNLKFMKKMKCESSLHLTLRYLGECGSVDFVITQLSKVNIVPFAIKTGKLGYFDNDDAIVIWSGVEGDLMKLNGLKAEIDRVLDNSTYEVGSHPFRPHISLFSIYDKTIRPQQIIKGIACRPAKIQIDQFKLFAIYEGQTGYTEICTFR